MGEGILVGVDSAPRLRRLAEDLVGRVDDDPVDTLEEARRLSGIATSDGDAAAAAIAGRATGLALLYLGRVTEAIAALETTAVAAADGGEAGLAALARMSLAGPLTHAGRPRDAMRQLDLAGAVLTGVDLGRVELQRAQVMHRQAESEEDGRRVEAAFRSAVTTFRESGDDKWLGQALNGWGLHCAYQGRIGAATKLLGEAAEVYRRGGFEASAADMLNNLGFVSTLDGDFLSAQRHFAAAEREYRRIGMPLAELLNDRCMSLLSVGLAIEARDAAAAAFTELAAAGAAADATDAVMLHAHACLLVGDGAAAEKSAARAVREYGTQKRFGWQLYARSLRLRARVVQGRRTRRDREAAERLADQMQSTGLFGPAVQARLLASRLATAHGETDRAARLIGQVRAVGAHVPIEQQIDLWLAEALNRDAGGDRRGALRAVNAGLGALDRYQAVLGATDVRAHVRGFGAELGDLGLRLAVAGGRPARVLHWMERTRAGALRVEPIRPPPDPGLAELLAELRSVVSDLREAELEGDDDPELRDRRVRLQAAVRRRSRSRGSAAPAAALPTASAFRDALQGTTLIEIAAVGNELAAVVVDKRARRARLGPRASVLREADRLRSALTRLATGGISERSRAANTDAAVRAARELDRILLLPLGLGPGPAVVVPPPELYALPWALLPSMRDRPFTVSPSASLWYRRSTRSGEEGRPDVLAAGPGLPHAAAEVRALGRVYPDARRFTARRSRARDVAGSLDGAGTAHIACHGSFRPHHPMFSALEFGDGPLFVHELERLGTAPATLVLSACDSGLSAARPGNEMLGLASSLLGLGTRTLVGSVIPVPDAATTRRLMVAFHRGLVAGMSPSIALVEARANTGASDDLVTAGAFVCFGVG